MIVFMNSLKRLLKNKVQIIVMLIIPLITITPMALSSHTTSKDINVGIVDEDNTKFSKLLIDHVKDNVNVIKMNKENIKAELNNSRIDYAVVIPRGYTYDIMNLKNKKVEGYEENDKGYETIIGGIFTSFVYPARNIAKVTGRNDYAFYKGITKIPHKKLASASPKKDNLKVVIWGMVIQFAMFSSIFTAALILKDRKNKTLYRSLNSPISIKYYMFQMVLSFVCISILQIIFMYFVIVYGFGFYSGKSRISFLVLMTLFSFLSVSFGVAISTITKNMTRAVMFGVGIVTVMSMLGGCWGMEPSNIVVKNISKVLPTTWIMDGMKKILDNKSFNSLGQDFAILLGFTIVFFLLGTWRKKDIV